MRRFEKENLIKIIRGIAEVHNSIGDCLKRGETERAISLLAECQNSAMQLGELIEKMDSSATAAVEKLEAYCETAFQIAEQISEANNPLKAAKKLDRSLTAAENSISNEIKTRLEVAFLPYKASMWDSMESVWLAARDDPDCDAYVVPIPYYDRNPDMSFGQFHYEGSEFPANVPVTFYEKYDLAQRKPDIVFIHNAYDGNNYVTSVDPRFYSFELKKYTPLLIYIDYGIPIWVPRKTIVYDTIPSVFCEVDAIVCYSREHASCSGFTLKERGFGSVDAVGLGSPKFDKVLRDSRANYSLPEEIAQKLANRKAILINSSIGAFLSETEKYLDHLENVFAVFKETEGAVPWWRPHPLLRATAKSMRPDLLARYDGIAEDYQKSGMGIYDDSPNVHRAIQWTDAYYGDESSLVYLYCATGKPFTICRSHTSDALIDETDSFERALDYRVDNINAAPGANIYSDDYACVWWANFWETSDYVRYLRLYLDFVLHPEKYPRAEEYRDAQLKLFREFVVNPDGTAGEKIYRYAKNRSLRRTVKARV